MSLNSGTRLGPYEILAPLGAGGMGEVYRARDTRLGREVAVKVLPEHLSANPEVRARFEREAKTISSFNHPHICTLYDVGQEGDTHFLVMELIDGQTLADQLDRGPLPTTEVLRIGAQIADALDRAHRAGVVHRDLKPSNVMLTKSGAKLMDFGLARPTLAESEEVGRSVSPTMSRPLTAEGTIVGTFQYMAPEQMEGKESDARSDLWALGCVLYEMVTGKRAFSGASQASLIGKIMNGEPAPMRDLQPLTPPGLEQVVKACLVKDPNDRVQSAHDVKLQLAWIAEGGSQAGIPITTAARRRGRERTAWGLVTVLGLVLIGVVGWNLLHPVKPPGPLRLRIQTSIRDALEPEPAFYALSPDGSKLAIAVRDSNGMTRLWLQPLTSVEARLLPGSESGVNPFWSPDSRYVCFTTVDRLKKIDLRGGAPETICPVQSYGRGGDWSPGGTILLATGPEGPLYRVSASGGEPEQVTRLDSLETGHRFPRFLPDGRHFLYASLPGRGPLIDIYVGDLETGTAEYLLDADGVPVFSEPGYLVYSRNDVLLAQPFDPARRRFTGDPVSLREEASYTQWSGAGRVTASRQGTLAYLAALTVDTPLHRFHFRDQSLERQRAPEGRYEAIAITDDGTRAALVKRVSASESELWILDLASGTASRLTSGPGRVDNPVFSPDGQQVVYSSNQEGAWEMYVRDTHGTSPPVQLPTTPSLFKYPYDWSPDGSVILYSQLARESNWDLWTITTDSTHTPRLYLQTDVEENFPAFSPDGKWVAYASFETGRPEIAVRSYPIPGRALPISRDGGLGPRWRPDGKVIYFRGTTGEVLAAPFSPDGTGTREGIPRVEMPSRFPEAVAAAAAPDFSYALLALPEESRPRQLPLTIVTNWQAQLTER